MLIKEILHDIRFRSFFMGGDLVCEVLVLFFKMSIAGWISLTVSEGVSKFTVLNSEPELIELSGIGDDFAYPIRSLSGLDKFLGLEVLAVYEYKIKSVEDGCVGVYLDFGSCGLSITESDECLRVVDGLIQYPGGEIVLHEIDV